MWTAAFDFGLLVLLWEVSGRVVIVEGVSKSPVLWASIS